MSGIFAGEAGHVFPSYAAGASVSQRKIGRAGSEGCSRPAGHCEEPSFRSRTGPLNRVISRAMEKYAPPLVHGRRFKVLYAAQLAAKEARGRFRRCNLFSQFRSLTPPTSGISICKSA